MSEPHRKRRSWFKRAVFGIAALMSVAAAFSLPSQDAASLQEFITAAKRWQTNPEFRQVAVEYSVLGSEAMRRQCLFVPTTRIIMFERSLPFVPKGMEVNPTSYQHYQDFSKGTLSAYLHLCGEQDVHDMTNVFTSAGSKTNPTDADLAAVLDAYKMDFPVLKDRGACQSVAALLRDTQAGGGFIYIDDITPHLREPIADLAKSLGFPEDPAQMSVAQQQMIFDRLDSYIHASNWELWRTKQVNDFSIGVWAQVYGPEYRPAIQPFLIGQEVGKAGLIVLLLLLVVSVIRKSRAQEIGNKQTEVLAAESVG